jgi:hypothetical protein
MATVIVLSDIASAASIGRGGVAMYELQWLHGLERRGHRVLSVEFLQAHADSREARARYYRDTISTWWHPEQCALILEESSESLYGLDAGRVACLASEADAVFTLAARYRREPFPLIDKIRPRILIEQDPAYTHLWAAEGDPAEIFGEHDFYYTVGTLIGSPSCSVPTLGISWRPIWNPVVLEWWAGEWPLTRGCFTTVGDWNSYGYLEFQGEVLGPKAEEFRKFVHLPRLVGEPVELALCIDADHPDRDYLHQFGWKIENPEVVRTPGQYRDYVAGSAAEFSCAKGGYAGTHCGWFSDRSACYLAAGRPVVLQATGFEDVLPTGEGLFAVSTAEEAAEAIRAIRRDYALHRAAARALAQEYFDSDKVLSDLLVDAGLQAQAGRLPATSGL